MTEDLSENKENKLKRRREEESQNDDCGDSSLVEQVAEIYSKLDKLLNAVCEFDSMKTRLTEVEEENRKLKETSENTGIEM